MTATDLNGDGRADLIVASNGEPSDTGLEPEQMLVRLGNADGTFGTVLRSSGPYLSERLVVRDMNADARPDVVSFNHYGDANVYLSDGTGRLLPGGYSPGCENARGGSAADFNGDGYGDLAILCRDEGITYLRVSVGDALGNYSPIKLYGLTPNSVVSLDSDAGDLNGDGALDLVIVGAYNGLPRALVHWTMVPRTSGCRA